MRLEARNFAIILIFIPFTTYEKTSSTKLAGRAFQPSLKVIQFRTFWFRS